MSHKPYIVCMSYHEAIGRVVITRRAHSSLFGYVYNIKYIYFYSIYSDYMHIYIYIYIYIYIVYTVYSIYTYIIHAVYIYYTVYTIYCKYYKYILYILYTIYIKYILYILYIYSIHHIDIYNTYIHAQKRRSNGWPKLRSNELECVRMAKSEKRFSQSVCMAFKLFFNIQPFAWHIHDVRMTCYGKTREKFELFRSKCVVKTAT